MNLRKVENQKMTEPKVFYKHKSGVLFEFDVMSDSETIPFVLLSDYDKLKQQLERAEKVIERLTQCHFPKKACKGSDLAQVMLQENVSIAKQYFTEKESGE